MNQPPMRAWDEPNPDCLLVKRDEAHGGHDLAGPGGAKPGAHCGGIGPWRPDDHPPHQWPIGTAASWRDGHGCPTIWCKGEGPRRDEARA